ncbi:Uncharacterized protein, contains caspase domain [Bradyrhizobium arachidis]|nr:Uncharacterized protein, contains caspase domain [Bradyrhizobium arachidis]
MSHSTTAASVQVVDVAVVYYAGHGIEIDGINYLIPVDAVLDRDRDVYDEALSLERVLVAVEPAKKLRLVILDACRDNPFTRSMKRTLASRAVGRGLAKVEPTSPNTLIAFASKAGSTASDGDGKYSPFTRALVNHVAKPGLDVRKAFGYVRDDVLKSTGNKQEPYLYGSLGGDDLPLVPAKPAATGPQADPQTAVRRDYELALQIGTRDVWTAFLAQYPDGFYASLAKGQLARIAAEDARLAAAEKARLAEQEKARLAAEKTKQIEPQKAATAKQAELAAEKAGEEKGQQLAAVAPVDQLEKPPVDLPRALQAELRRVGCNPGAVDGNWGERSQRALNLFNTHSGLRLEAKAAAMSRRRANVPLRRRRCCRLRYREAREKPVLATRKAVLVCRLPVEFGRFSDTL